MPHVFSLLALGLLLGVRHATDVDHVVAVTTIVSRERSPRGALGIGAFWGFGHTATILVVGGAIIVFGVVIPPRLGLSFELSVAVMLVILGVLNLSGATRRVHEPAHPQRKARPGPVAIFPESGAACSRRARALRPLAVGVVHGLAGSAAIALAILATIREPVAAIGYLAVFGLGTILGMALLTATMAFPMARAARFSETAERFLVRATGIASVLLGLFLAYRIGIADGLLFGTPKWTPE